MRVLVIFGTSVLPPRLCLTCGFPPTFGYCAIGMYSDWVYHLNLNMVICCCHFISAFLVTERVSGFWDSNFEPKPTPPWFSVLRDLRHEGCYLCMLLIHSCMPWGIPSQLITNWECVAPLLLVPKGMVGHG